LNNLWLLLALAAFASLISIRVIPREEQFLERNFQAQYSEYKATVRRYDHRSAGTHVLRRAARFFHRSTIFEIKMSAGQAGRQSKS
jgi:hypothetical protein